MKVKKIFSVVLTAVLVALMLPMNILPVSAADGYAVIVTGGVEDATHYATLNEALDAVQASVVATAKPESIPVIRVYGEVELQGSAYNIRRSLTVEGGNEAAKINVLSTGSGVFATGGVNQAVNDTDNGMPLIDFKNIEVTSSTAAAVFAVAGANLVLENCKVNNDKAQCVNFRANNATLDVTGGSMTSKAVTINNSNSSYSNVKVVLNGGVYTGDGHLINNAGANFNLLIKNGTFYGKTKANVIRHEGTSASANIEILNAEMTGVDTPVIQLNAAATMKIWDGTYTTDADPAVFNLRQATATTSEAESAVKAYLYGGTYIQKSNLAERFCMRPWNGASLSIYGGNYITSTGRVLGVGTSTATGFLYVFGGTFRKLTSAGAGSVGYNGVGNVYLYGGEFYTAKDADANLLKGAKDSKGNLINLVNQDALTVEQVDTDETYEGVTFQKKTTLSYDLTGDTTAALSVTLPGGLTVGTDSAYRAFDRIACDGSTVALLADITDTVKAPALDALTVDYDGHTAAALDLSACTNLTEIKADTVLFTGADYFQLANSNETSTDIRFVTAIDKAESAEYVKAGFLISLGNRTPRMGGAKVITTETREVYTSLRAAEEDVAAPDGAYWLACAVRGIPADAYDTVIWIRPYAVDADGNVVYGASFAVCVADVLG